MSTAVGDVITVADNGDEPDSHPGEAWYCRHCGARGYAEKAPVSCPNCGEEN